MQRHLTRFLLPLTLCLIISLFLESPLFFAVRNPPPHTINMLVGHYFEDYYEYLSFMKQGEKRTIFFENLFTTDDNQKYVTAWWPYSLIGLLNSFLPTRIPIQYLYWIASTILCTIFLLLVLKSLSLIFPIEKVAYRYLSFFLIVFSTSFYSVTSSKNLVVLPVDYWYSLSTPFSRFSIVVPHQQMAHIFLIIALIIFIKIQAKRKPELLPQIAMHSSISLILLSISPPVLIIYWSSIALSLLIITFRRKEIISLTSFIFSVFLVFPFALKINEIAKNSPTLKSVFLWDINHIYYPDPKTVFMTFGPLTILSLLAIPLFLKKFSTPKVVFFITFAISFVFAHIPLLTGSGNVLTNLGFHNLRFLTPVMYVFIGSAPIFLLERIVKRRKFVIIAGTLLLIYFVPVIYQSYQSRKSTPQSAGHLQWMPQELFDGLKWLEKKDDNAIILSSPNSIIGVAIPALTQKHTYIGRSILTVNRNEKATVADYFYHLTLSEKEAGDFLRKEKIDYIIFSPFDGNQSSFISHYPFLKSVFRNDWLTIYDNQIQ